jgi:hypothetical protein
MKERYFHGGNRKLQVGDYILPPSETGASGMADLNPLCRRDRVYLAPSTVDALFLLQPPQIRSSMRSFPKERLSQTRTAIGPAAHSPAKGLRSSLSALKRAPAGRAVVAN